MTLISQYAIEYMLSVKGHSDQIPFLLDAEAEAVEGQTQAAKSKLSTAADKIAGAIPAVSAATGQVQADDELAVTHQHQDSPGSWQDHHRPEAAAHSSHLDASDVMEVGSKRFVECSKANATGLCRNIPSYTTAC